MFGSLLVENGKLHRLLVLPIIVFLVALLGGCSESPEMMTSPDSGSLNIGEETSTFIPDGDDVDDALFTVSAHRFPGGGPGCWLFSQLELTEEQIAAIAEAYAEARAELFELVMQLKNGEITEEEFLAASKAIHEELHNTIMDILTDEQKALLEELLRDRLLAMLNARIENGEDRIARRVSFLTKILDLDEDQQNAITEILNNALLSLIDIRDRLEAGEIDTKEAREAIVALFEATKALIREQLTEEQLAILDSFRHRSLCRRHGGHRHGGHRRGGDRHH